MLSGSCTSLMNQGSVGSRTRKNSWKESCWKSPARLIPGLPLSGQRTFQDLPGQFLDEAADPRILTSMGQSPPLSLSICLNPSLWHGFPVSWKWPWIVYRMGQSSVGFDSAGGFSPGPCRVDPSTRNRFRTRSRRGTWMVFLVGYGESCILPASLLT